MLSVLQLISSAHYTGMLVTGTLGYMRAIHAATTCTLVDLLFMQHIEEVTAGDITGSMAITMAALVISAQTGAATMVACATDGTVESTETDLMALEVPLLSL